MSQFSFFDQYPAFHQDQTAPILDEFYRLARNMRWKRYSIRWKIQRRECLQAESAFQFGSIEANNKLAGWQGLCEELGLGGNLASIKKHKMVREHEISSVLVFTDPEMPL